MNIQDIRDEILKRDRTLSTMGECEFVLDGDYTTVVSEELDHPYSTIPGGTRRETSYGYYSDGYDGDDLIQSYYREDEDETKITVEIVNF
ncbi:MAG: hypothetical protein ABEN55_11955 [Bradymonadaceae bacterium]